jgi:hypothetical protein
MPIENQIERDVKLSDCVMMYIDESKQTTREFRRLWALAFRGLTDIGLDVSWTPKTTLINVNANLTANVPTDFIDWVKIGVFNSLGEVATLRVNEQLTTYRDNVSTRLTDIQSEVGEDANYLQYPYWLGGWDDNGYEHYFGAGSSLVQAGECRFDKANGLIVLDPHFAYTQVVLEYISSPIMDDDYSVDLKCQEALIAWLRFKDIQSLPSNRMVNISEKQFRQREYFLQKKLARKRVKPFRTQVSEQYSRESQRLAIKG